MGQPILEVEHLKKSYVNNVPILDDVSFSLQKGEVVVIVGPSGCGKSTFLRCINRLEEIDTGVLKLNGVSYEKEKKNISKATYMTWSVHGVLVHAEPEEAFHLPSRIHVSEVSCGSIRT